MPHTTNTRPLTKTYSGSPERSRERRREEAHVRRSEVHVRRPREGAVRADAGAGEKVREEDALHLWKRKRTCTRIAMFLFLFVAGLLVDSDASLGGGGITPDLRQVRRAALHAQSLLVPVHPQGLHVRDACPERGAAVHSAGKAQPGCCRELAATRGEAYQDADVHGWYALDALTRAAKQTPESKWDGRKAHLAWERCCRDRAMTEMMPIVSLRGRRRR